MAHPGMEVRGGACTEHSHCQHPNSKENADKGAKNADGYSSSGHSMTPDEKL